MAAILVYLALAATVLAPVDKHGSRLVHMEIQSQAVGRELGVNVIVPKQAGPSGKRWLLVFLHGRGGSEETFKSSNPRAGATPANGKVHLKPPTPWVR